MICKCGNELDAKGRNKSGQCAACIHEHATRPGARQPDADHLRDVPRMSKREYEIIMKVDNNGEPPIHSTRRADAIVKRGIRRVKEARRRYNII